MTYKIYATGFAKIPMYTQLLTYVIVCCSPSFFSFLTQQWVATYVDKLSLIFLKTFN